MTSSREQHSFMATRTALRHLLARYMDADPDAILIRQRPGGKPEVDGAPAFSVTHSGPLALIAVAADAVGIDVERIRAPRSRRVLLRIFHPATIAALDGMDADEFPAAFTAAWTQREAHVKAEGGGLFRTPDVLPFEPRADNHVLRRSTGRDGSSWSVSHWREGADMFASLVAAAPITRVRHLAWSPEELDPQTREWR